MLSFQREVLESVAPLLTFEEAPVPAQARLHVGDVSRSNLAGMLNMLGYVRAKRTSEGNLRLLDSLTRQLHVPPKDALATAERLLDAKLVCPVGKTYELAQNNGGQAHWISPALLDPAAGRDYLFPPLEWFRGLTANAMTTGNLLEAHVEIDMRLPDPPQARSVRR